MSRQSVHNQPTRRPRQTTSQSKIFYRRVRTSVPVIQPFSYSQMQELQSRLHILQNSLGSIDGVHMINSSASPARSKSPHVNSTTGENTPTSREDPTLISKMAERVKLKKVECGDKHVLGSEMSSVGVSANTISIIPMYDRTATGNSKN